MTTPGARLAVGLGALSAMLVAAGITAAFSVEGRPGARESWSLISFVLPIAAFSAVGGAVVVRRPGNVIGWLLAAIGLLFAIVVACSGIAVWALETGSLPTAAGEWISLGSNAWVVAPGDAGGPASAAPPGRNPAHAALALVLPRLDRADRGVGGGRDRPAGPRLAVAARPVVTMSERHPAMLAPTIRSEGSAR